MKLRRAATEILVLLAVLAGAAACASTTRGRPEAFPRAGGGMPGASRPVSPAVPDGPAVAASGPAWLETALRQRGVRYRLGGTSPAAGFDCSGLVQYAFAAHGIALPRTTAEQFTRGSMVARQDLAPGDLVFFSTTGPGPTHVGIAADTERFVHAPDEGGAVRVEHFATPYWSTRFLGARRISPAPVAQ